jgi:hypothetical protein
VPCGRKNRPMKESTCDRGTEVGMHAVRNSCFALQVAGNRVFPKAGTVSIEPKKPSQRWSGSRGHNR